MSEETCGAEVLANELLASLTLGKSFDLPDVNLGGAEFQLPATFPSLGTPVPLTNELLTEKKPDGAGTFDIIMSSLSEHLKEEYAKNRLSGAEYSKTYIAGLQAALSGGIQFLLGKDTAYWQAVRAQSEAQTAQIAAVTARVQLEIAKAQLKQMRFEALTAEAGYALTKMKLSTESINYCTGKFQLNEMLPQQKLMLIAQREAAEEGVEVARAQTLNTRKDGTPIVGVVGKQRDLYDQQIQSYKRDAEVKVMKIFSDAWITMKGLDEGLLPPTPFTNASLDVMLGNLKSRVGLDDPIV